MYSLRSKLEDILRILKSQNNLKFDQDYREKYKVLWYQIDVLWKYN